MAKHRITLTKRKDDNSSRTTQEAWRGTGDRGGTEGIPAHNLCHLGEA